MMRRRWPAIVVVLAAACSAPQTAPARYRVEGTLVFSPQNECRRAETEASGFPGGATPSASAGVRPVLAGVPVVLTATDGSATVTVHVDPASVATEAGRCIQRGRFTASIPRAPGYRIQARFFPVFSASLPTATTVSWGELAARHFRVVVPLELTSGE